MTSAAAGGVDLHLHSTCSDGLNAPAEVMELAAKAGLTVVALTDHDTFDGLAEAGPRAAELGLELIAGVEISCKLQSGSERHLLGYGMDTTDVALRAGLSRNRAQRGERLTRMLAALRTVGVEVTEEAVRREAGGRTVGRPHVADALVRAGRVKSRQEAFDRWLGDGKVGAVSHDCIAFEEAVGLLHGAGGIAVLAHPGRRRGTVDLTPLAALGLDGVEVTHPSHGPDDVKMIAAQAAHLGLLATGGSDCHGDREGLRVLRARNVPMVVAERLRERLQRKVAPQPTGESAGG